MFKKRPDLQAILGLLIIYVILFTTLLYVFGLSRIPIVQPPRIDAHQVYIPMVFSDYKDENDRLDEVPFYSQKDPRWYWTKMGGNCPCNTIGACGCALTSTAMVFSYFGVSYNPKQLNKCMGKYACPFDWKQAAKRCGNGVVFYEGRYNFNWARLDRYLNEYKYPVIIGMYWADNANYTHFVVAVSGSGNDASNYLIHDPNRLMGKNIRMDVLSREGWRFRWMIVYEDKEPA